MMGSIDQKSLMRIEIPLPDKDTMQVELVKMMDEAYALKKEKEQKAKELLDSIDNFVMKELGIEKVESVEKSVFGVNVSQLTNRRIDPKVFSNIPVSIVRSIKNSKYESSNIKDLIVESFAGEWGNDLNKNKNGDEVYKVLRNTNFINEGNLSYLDVAQRSINKDKFVKVQINKGDILIEKSGGSPAQPVGRVAVFDLDDKNYTFSNFLQCFRLNSSCDSHFFFNFLKLVYNLRLTEYHENQTTGIKNLIMESFLEIPVPLPPLEIQQKIADEVEKRRSEAFRLQNEAKQILEAAKRDFEAEVLG